jgi:NADPH:quinone reductase-like Zn-dependent oxidoreductase
VLVIGASGTVGSAIVQLALDAGAQVTGMASTANLDLVHALGAEALDYTGEDMRTRGAVWDVIADAAGALDWPRAQAMLAEGGRYLAINAGLGAMLARAKGTRRIIAGPAEERREDMEALVDLAVQGRFRPLIDSVRPFAELPAAHARADSGRKRGSAVVIVT